MNMAGWRIWRALKSDALGGEAGAAPREAQAAARKAMPTRKTRIGQALKIRYNRKHEVGDRTPGSWLGRDRCSSLGARRADGSDTVRARAGNHTTHHRARPQPSRRCGLLFE